MKVKDFKFKTDPMGFQPISLASFDEQKGLISVASLDNLKDIIPEGYTDFETNEDLLPISFNAAVANMFNKWGVCVDGAGGVVLAPMFKGKPTNIEHNTEDVVGHIIDYGFSTYEETPTILSSEDCAAMTDPYNISLASVVYKMVDEKFAKLVEKSADSDDDLYHVVSASWEVYYNDFDIGLGSDLLSECEVVTDKKHKKELQKYLKSKGGSGVYQNAPIGIVLKQPFLPVGIGYTTAPAADVKGLYTNIKEASIKKKENISHSNTINVNSNNDTPKKMDIQDFMAKIEPILTEHNLSKETVASMTETFTNAIKEKDEVYKKQLTAEKEKHEALTKAQADLQSNVETLTSELKEAKEKISQFEETQAAQEAQNILQSRMQEIDDTYELDDTTRKVVLDRLGGVDSDESFASYKEELSVLMKHLNKETIASANKDFEEKLEEEVAKRLKTTASTKDDDDGDNKDDDAQAALDNASTKTEEPPNNTDGAPEKKDVCDRFREAFEKDKKSIVEIS